MKKIITVVSTRDHAKKVFESEASTLGELKAELDAQHFDYAGMTFFEGLSKTELVSDESVLPSNIPYKGDTTNNLLFMLTNPNKKISSGSERSDLYREIKERGLEEDVKEEYGKNYTLCSNAELREIIDEDSETPSYTRKEIEDDPSVKAVEVKDKGARAGLSTLLNILNCTGYIEDDDVAEVEKAMNGSSSVPESSVKSPYDDNEIDKILGNY